MSSYISKKEIEEKDDQYISEEDAMILLYIFALLDAYDKADNNNKPSNDPYKQKIFVKSEEGLNLMIPEDMRKYAVHKWIESKNSAKSTNEMDSDEKSSCNTSFMDNVIQLIVCLLIVFIFMYSLSCFRKGMAKFNV